MADPVIGGVVLTPTIPVPGQPFTARVTADDPDLHVSRKFLVQITDLNNGDVVAGQLTTVPEDLAYSIVPADPASPDLIQDVADETLFHGLCPSGVATLSYLAVVQDGQDHAATFPFSVDIPQTPVPPIPGPVDPPTPPENKTLIWEATTDLDANGDFSPYGGTATNDPAGSQDVYVVDAPPESGFTGKVGEFHYTGTKDSNRSVSYRPPSGQRMDIGDYLVFDFLLSVPKPDGVNSYTTSGRKLVYNQPRLNGENHFVFSIAYGSGGGALGLGTIETTFTARTLPTTDKPNGMLQRLRVGGWEFGTPMRIVANLQAQTVIDAQNGFLEMWVGRADLADFFAQARYGRLDNLRYMTMVNFPIIDHRVGQQVNENGVNPDGTLKAYDEKRWYKRISEKLYR